MRRGTLRFAFVIAAIWSVSAARADLYWDINGANSGGSDTTSASGTWDGGAVLNPADYNSDTFVNAADYVSWRKSNINGSAGYDTWRQNFGGTTTPGNSFWSTDPLGGSATGAWVPDAIAVFSAGSNVTGASTITLSGTRSASGLKFEEGNVTIGGGTQLTLTGGGTVDVTLPAVGTVSSVIAGSAGLTKTGDGTLTLGGTNTFTNGVNINGGVVSVGTDANLGNASNSLSINNAKLLLTGPLGTLATPNTRNISLAGNGTVEQSAGAASWLNGIISDGASSGGLTKSGTTSLVVLNQNNSYTGDTVVTAGTLVSTGARSLGNNTISGNTNQKIHLNAASGTATLRMSANGYTETRPLVLEAAGGQLDNNNSGITGLVVDATYGGVISGNFALTRIGGAGTITLSANNTFTGGVVLSNNSTAGVTAFPGETSTTTGAANPLGAYPAAAVANYINVTSSSTLRNTKVDTSGLSSFVTPNRGITIASGATFSADVADSTTSLNLSAIVTGAGRLAKVGAGTLKISSLSQANNYSGGTTISGGKLIFPGENSATAGANDPLGIVPAAATPGLIVMDNNAILSSTRLGTSATSFVLPNRGVTLNAGGGTWDMATNNTILLYSGVMTGAGRLTVTASGGNGTLRLTGSNTRTGGTTIDPNAIVSITLDLAMGALPSPFDDDNLIINGGTMRFENTSALTFNVNRGTQISPNNGKIDVVSSTVLYNAPIGKTAGTFTATLTKTGTGELRMSGANQVNTFDKLVVLGGTYGIGQSTTLGQDTQLGAVPTSPLDDAVTLDGGILRFLGGTSATNIALDQNRGITVTTNSANTFLLDGSSGTINGKISGGGALNKTGPFTLTLGNTNNSYAGATNVTAGTLKLGASGVIPDTSAVTVTGTLDMNNFNETIGSLAGAGAVTMSGNLTTGGDGTPTIYSGAASGAGSLTKVGGGTMTLTGGNTYGSTLVTGGKLLVNGSIAGTALVNNGGTLGGTGSIVGLITANTDTSGGTIQPGSNGIGTLTGNGGLDLESGSILDIDLGTAAPSGYGVSDLVDVSALASGLTINGGSVSLTDAGGLGAGTYKLISYSGSVQGAGYTALGTPTGPAGFTYALLDSGTSIDLQVTSAGAGAGLGAGAVPEPTSAALLLLGVLPVMMRRRR